MSIELRPYQEDAIAAIESAWDEGFNRTSVVIATGGGKTTIFSDLIRRHGERLRKEGKRVLVLAHRAELLSQGDARIKLQNPGLWTTIIKGSQGQKTHQFADVIVGSVQTLSRPKRREAVDRIGMVIVDECHSVSQGLKDILTHYGCMEDGGTPTVGFTATMTRMNGGLGEVWQSVAYQRKIHQLIKDGYLVAPKALSVNVPGLNLATTRVTAGDLNTKDLADALEESAAFDVIAEVWQDKASERPTVAFMPNVATARRLAATLQQRDVAAEVIHGGMDKEARDGVYARYDSGATRVIVNVMCLTEGWDAPRTSCAIIGRPTLNPGLFIQMVGRALRLHPGKKDALILDLAGASSRHTLAGVNDLESECEASCGCNCLSCGCNGLCKCALRRCGCSCIEAHGVNGRDCRCCGSDECRCGCIPEDEGGPGCLCADNPDCGCRGEGPEKEQKEVDASVLRNLVQVDILGECLTKSSYTWLDTPAGIKFLAFGPDAAAFLLPDPAAPGMYFQGIVRGTRQKAPIERVDSGSLPADAAMKGLEELVSASGWTYSSKRASWRRTPASDAQLSLLRRYRPELPTGIKKGEASDMLSSFRFGAALDERFGKYVRRERETASGQAR